MTASTELHEDQASQIDVESMPLANHLTIPAQVTTQDRRLSAEVLSLIDKAFPIPAFSIERADDIASETQQQQVDDPPVYDDGDEPPRYAPQSHGSLMDRLSAPHMTNAFSVRVRFKRVTMEPPWPDAAIEVYSDLLLISPAMSFDLFLRQIQAKTREHILAVRPSKNRTLPGECMVHTFYICFREHRQGILRREKKSILNITSTNWAAVVASLRDGQASEVLVKYWTETPGSVAERTRRGSMESGVSRRMNVWWALWS